jgi:hypothetical protein
LSASSAEREDHALAVEAEKPAGAGGRAEHAAGRGDVPALGIVAGKDRAADPAFDLDAEHEGCEQIATGDRPQLGEREQRRRDRRGRMNGGRDVGIVEIEDVGARRVQERRAQRVHALVAADDDRLPAIGKRGERLQGDLDRAAAAARQRHGEVVHERALGLVRDVRWNVAPAGVDDEARKVLSDAGSVQHGAVPNASTRKPSSDARLCRPPGPIVACAGMT